MSLETALGNAIFNQPMNKAYTDKLLAKEDADKIEALIKKDELNPSDLRLLQVYLASNEVKLVNSSDHSRYILGKYLSWIYPLIDIQQFHIKNMERMKEKGFDTPLSEKNNRRGFKNLDENIKLLVGHYLYWLRSGVSLKMVGFNNLSSNRFEFQYSQPQNPQPKESNVLFGGN